MLSPLLALSAALLASAPRAHQPISAAWLARCGPSDAAALPTFDPSSLEGFLSGATPPPEGWRVTPLPFTVGLEPCWLVTRLPPSDQAVGIWFGGASAARTAWIDGSLVWRFGREAAPYWRSDPGMPALIVPRQLVTPEAPRVLVLRAFSRAGGVTLRAPTFEDPAEFPRMHDAQTGAASRVLDLATNLLLTVGLAGFILFAFRRMRAILYFSIAVTGFASLFLALTTDWLPFDHGYFSRLAIPGIFASYPFFALFFQRLYGLHVKPWVDLLVIAQLAAITALCLVLDESAILSIATWTAPLYMGWPFYSLYLNIRARREGNEIARSVLWGFGAYFGTIVFDAARYFAGGGGGELKNPTFQLGVLAFVASVIVAIVRRFLRLSVESRVMLAQLQGAAGELGGLVTHLQTASTQLSSATAEQVSSLTETASTTTEMNQTSALSATRCAELIEQGEAVASVVEDGKAAAATSRSAIQEISSSLATVSSASAELAERVQRIDRIIDTVSFLADQSAALAINASIEASRAGDAGQGFAAVAREVRSLANDSRRATSEVREVLDEIRKRTLQMERQVSQGGQVVEGGVRQVARLSEVVVTLGGTIQHAVGLMRQVEASARQNQAGVEQVLQAVTNIQRASESIRDGAETLTSLSRRANDLSTGLVSGSGAPSA